MEERYTFEEKALHTNAKRMRDEIERLVYDQDIARASGRADVAIQLAYKLASFGFIKRMCDRYDYVIKNYPREFSRIDTDFFLNLFREAIDMAEDVIKEKEKEYGI